MNGTGAASGSPVPVTAGCDTFLDRAPGGIVTSRCRRGGAGVGDVAAHVVAQGTLPAG